MIGMQIVIPGEPVAKGRPRFRVAGKFVQTYTPAKTKKEEARVKSIIKEQFKEAPLNIPIAINMIFSFAIPKSYTKKQRKEIELNFNRHFRKPDCDNIGKLYLDAMNGIVYKDDSQIYSLKLSKFYTEKEEGSVLIIIERL